jgi:hypothetical protein
MPLIRGPRSVYLRASLAFEAQARRLLGQRSASKPVERHWLLSGRGSPGILAKCGEADVERVCLAGVRN